jgi:serine/threonine protein kinase
MSLRMKAATAYRERFEIQKELGEGGFARVFLAREKATQRKVALKVLKDAYLSDKEVVERFRREVFAVASITSPHVVGMHDFGISGDEIYIAMEFVEGPTLRDLLYDRSWSAPEIHVVVGQIAQALAAAHRQNIVHRDLKPENVILVSSAGGARHVKVLDFGLAKLADLERQLGLEPLTRAGMCFGTPQYMAPELIRGKPFDKSVDLYALGVIAFELVAGYLPWDGIDPREVLISVVKNPPPHVTHAHPSVEPRIASVDKFLQRVLAKDAAERPRDAVGFFKDFEQALLGEKKPSRKSPQVPAEDAVFATVWAQSLDLRKSEDATEVDAGHRFGPAERTASGEVTKPGDSKRKLSSRWIPSIKDLETTQVDEASTGKRQAIPDNDLSDSMRDTDQDLRKAAQKAISGRMPTPVDEKKVTVDQALALADTEERVKKKVVVPAGDSFYGPRTDHTEMIKNPKRARSMVWWVVPLLIGLVIFAAALGYVMGRQR